MKKVEIRHRKNPNGTYRILLSGLELRIDSIGPETALFGDIANVLGEYLETGLTPEEIEQNKHMFGLKVKK